MTSSWWFYRPFSYFHGRCVTPLSIWSGNASRVCRLLPSRAIRICSSVDRWQAPCWWIDVFSIGAKISQDCSYIVDFLYPDVNFLIVSIDPIRELLRRVSSIVATVLLPASLHGFGILASQLWSQTAFTPVWRFIDVAASLSSDTEMSWRLALLNLGQLLVVMSLVAEKWSNLSEGTYLNLKNFYSKLLS